MIDVFRYLTDMYDTSHSLFSLNYSGMTKQKSSLQIENFSAIQTVKCEMHASGKTAIEYFSDKRVNPKLT